MVPQSFAVASLSLCGNDYLTIPSYHLLMTARGHQQAQPARVKQPTLLDHYLEAAVKRHDRPQRLPDGAAAAVEASPPSVPELPDDAPAAD